MILLQIFLEDINERQYGYELLKLLGWQSGKLYPMLAKLQAAGWVDTEMEQIDPSAERRPPRRWYRLSTRGVAMARQEIAAMRQEAAERPSRRSCGIIRPLGGEA